METLTVCKDTLMLYVGCSNKHAHRRLGHPLDQIDHVKSLRHSLYTHNTCKDAFISHHVYFTVSIHPESHIMSCSVLEPVDNIRVTTMPFDIWLGIATEPGPRLKRSDCVFTKKRRRSVTCEEHSLLCYAGDIRAIRAEHDESLVELEDSRIFTGKNLN